MTDRYAVIGNPIAQSKSPQIHLTFAKGAGHDISYVTLEAPIGGFADRTDAFRREGGLGLNVTTPFKLDAFAYASEHSESARLAGAVNALKFIGERVLAENFDGVGLANDIQRNLGYPMQGRRVLLLGAGGAARGAILPFLALNPARLLIVNRSIEKAHDLAAQFASDGPISAGGYADLAAAGAFDLVFNATSSSLRGELPPIPAANFAPGCLAYDLTYGKGLTPFLRAAREAGVERVADGVGMLVEQAAEAFEWWRGIRPETSPVIKDLTVPFV